jgi:integrase
MQVPERLPKPLEAGDLETLLDALPCETVADKRDRALVLLLLSTGARISEILRLDRADWKPERLWIVGKGDRERVVQVTDRARAAVDDYLEARRPLPCPIRWVPTCDQVGSDEPPDARRRALRMPSARALARDTAVSPSSATPHTRHAPAGDDGRRTTYRRHPRSSGAGLGEWLHEDQRSATT